MLSLSLCLSVPCWVMFTCVSLQCISCSCLTLVWAPCVSSHCHSREKQTRYGSESTCTCSGWKGVADVQVCQNRTVTRLYEPDKTSPSVRLSLSLPVSPLSSHRSISKLDNLLYNPQGEKINTHTLTHTHADVCFNASFRSAHIYSRNKPRALCQRTAKWTRHK